jgi:hypothetical protein
MSFGRKRAFATIWLTAWSLLATVGSAGAELPDAANPPGLEPHARQELRDAGVDEYVGRYKPATLEDAGNGWEKHLRHGGR